MTEETNNTPQTLREQLIRTKEELVSRGRTTSVLVDTETGCCCLLGAAGLAVLGEDSWRDKYSDSDGDLYYSPFSSNGEAKPVVDALIDAMPDTFLIESYGQTDDLGLDYSSVWDFNDNWADDAQVFELIDRAIEAA